MADIFSSRLKVWKENTVAVPRVVLLTKGNCPKAFCAGGDINEIYRFGKASGGRDVIHADKYHWRSYV